MISFISGKLVRREKHRVLVNVNGLGFSVLTPEYDESLMPKIGDDIFLWVRVHVSQREIKIYGFLDEREVEIFDRIVEIPKIGPQIALSIISHLGVDGLMRVLKEEDLVTLGEVPRVGMKSARRILSELKDEVSIIYDSRVKEIVEALYRLGYSKREVKAVLGYIIENINLPVEELIKKVLLKLGEQNG
ncbi:MAG: Holliday junction branch migration protein RuvA [Thermosulfidibacteraceae bacterium]|jgi:Holliday junction DNA helicase RuvA